MNKTILFEKKTKNIAIITLNRPEKRNSLTIAMMKEFIATLEAVKKDSKIRIVLLRGAGPCFCTGLDLDEAADITVAEESALLITELLRMIFEMPILTIAAVKGYAIAGGSGIVGVCDYVIAEEGAHFGFPEVQRGLVASIVITFLARHFGDRILRELFLFGELIDAQKAHHMHLVNKIVQIDDLEQAAWDFAGSALKSAPGAVVQLKKLIKDVYPSSLEEDLERALALHKLARVHVEAQEGIQAFKEKRKPLWCS